MIPVFDSRDSRCKSPFGALPSGQCAFLSVYPPRAEGLSKVTCVALLEQTGETREIPLAWTSLSGSQDVFSGTLSVAPDYVGLVWYHFRMERLGGDPFYYGPNGYEAHPASFQLTVYAPQDQRAPRWFGSGVTYQIFPDRFYKTGALPSPLPGRKLHESWSDAPDFLPDAEGKIRNCDFFGGTLRGIAEKLPYLQSLGVDTLYLCPIFKAAENHRYGVGDYETIDPFLGTEADFRTLCDEAHARGMRLILDGVFSHTGAISRYFNQDGSYDALGAAQSKESPYYPWYRFMDYPEEYDCWWGIKTLPEVNELEPSYLSYIVEGENSIVRRWLRAGGDGWRLDVADELPDPFIKALYRAAKETKPDAVIIGEVWEDGSNKISYGKRRAYLLGGHLDGLMNYPFRTALLTYLKEEKAAAFQNAMETLREHYPPHVFHSAMNLLGTHDTPRILTLLGAGDAQDGLSRAEKSQYRLDEKSRERAVSLVKLAFLILFSFPGSPAVYYGDEIGMEGWEDPFNRAPFPWGQEDAKLLSYVSLLASLRRRYQALQTGQISYLLAEGSLLCFTRATETERVTTLTHCGKTPKTVRIPWDAPFAVDCLTGACFEGENGLLSLSLSPFAGLLLREAKEKQTGEDALEKETAPARGEPLPGKGSAPISL
ncbi:MAG: glycoside hydrolase family 13 protein [Oscillospiraceae bacterium]